MQILLPWWGEGTQGQNTSVGLGVRLVLKPGKGKGTVGTPLRCPLAGVCGVSKTKVAPDTFDSPLFNLTLSFLSSKVP